MEILTLNISGILKPNENMKKHGSSLLSQEELVYAEMSCQFQRNPVDG